MINLISGGDYKNRGYCYRLYITLPEMGRSKTINMYGSEHKHYKFSLPTKIELTINSIYYNIVFRVLGFGLGLEIQSKS